MRLNESPSPIDPTSPQEGTHLFAGSVLAATLLTVVSLAAPHNQATGDGLIEPASSSFVPNVPVRIPQRAHAPESPYLPDEKRLRETVGLQSCRAPKPDKLDYPPFQGNLKESVMSQGRTGIVRKQPAPHNMHGLTGSNHGVDRNRRGRR